MDREQAIEQYDDLLKHLARNARVNYYEYEDILQELYMVAITCADKFDDSKGTAFSTYLTKSCQYKIKELRIKNRHYNEPLDELVGDGTTFLDMLQDPYTQSPELWTLEQDILAELDKLPYGNITRMYFLEGKSQIEIAEELGLSQSYVNKVNRKNIEHLSAIFNAD